MQKLHETIRDNVDRESRPLPSQTLQGVVAEVKEAQSAFSDPGGGETVSRGRDWAAGQGTEETNMKHG